MAVERSALLPEGRYAVTLLGNLQIERFDEWLRRHRDFVSPRSSDLDQEAKPVSAFIVFDVDVSDVVRWEGPGFPTIVESGTTGPIPSREDFEQTPEVLEPAEQLSSFFDSVRPALPVLLLLAVAFLWNKESKS